MADNTLNTLLGFLPPDLRKAYEKGKLDDDDVLEWGKQAGYVKDRPAQKTVSSPKPTTSPGPLDRLSNEFGELRRVGGAMVDSAIGGVKQIVAGHQLSNAEIQKPQTSFEIARGFAPPTKLSEQELAEVRARAFARGREAEERNKSAQRALDQVQPGVKRTIAQGLTDLSGSAASTLPSLVGGPVGAAVAGTSTYDQEYLSARMAGASPEEADKHAKIQGGIEAGVSSIPAGKLLQTIGFKAIGRDALDSTASQVGKRIAKTMAGESIEESATTALQVGANKLNAATTDDEKVKAFAEANTQNFWEQMKRSAVAGAFGAGIFASPVETFSAISDAGKLAGKAAQGQMSSEKDIKRERTGDKGRTNEVRLEPVQPDMFGTPAGLPTPEDYITAQRLQSEEAAKAQVLKRLQIDDAFNQNNPPVNTDELFAQHERVTQLDQSVRGLDNPQMAEAMRRAGLDKIVQATTPKAEPTTAPSPLPTGTEQQPLPLNEPLQPADSVTLKAQLEDKRARDAARKLIEEDTTTVQRKAMAKREADRRIFMRTVAESSRDIPDHDTRTQYVMDAAAKWEQDNPIDKFIKQATTARTKARGAKAPPLPTVATTITEDGVVDESPIRSDEGILSVDQLKKANGLSQKSTTTEGTGVRKEHVFGTLSKNKHSGDAKVIHKLLADKNMVIVDDASEIPSGAIPQGTGGFYDGKRTYIVANQLSQDNMMGDMLNIAAHETKHAADTGAGPEVRASMSNFVGQGVNKRIGAKIENQAKSDSAINGISFDQLGTDLTSGQEDSLTGAQWAVHAAKKGSSDAHTYGLELPAYFINAARDARAMKGSAGQIKENIVAAVRVAAKKRFGDSADVNLKDVAYLSDKLLKETAYEGKRQTGSIDTPLPMIAGKKATGFEQARASGEDYISVDGKSKFLFSDADASVNESGIHDLENSGEVFLSGLLNHKLLYENYPFAEDIEVSIDDESMDSKRSGAYLGNGRIVISAEALDKSISDMHEFRNLILHEVQHYVQDVEDHANGSNSDMFLTEKDHKVLDDYADITDTIKNQADGVADILSRSPITDKEDANTDLTNVKEAFKKKVISNTEFLDQVALTLRGAATSPYARDLYNRIVSNLTSGYNLSVEASRIKDRAFQQYLNTLGEQEARFTEANSRKSKAALPRNPELLSKKDGGFDAVPAEDSVIVRNGKIIGVAKETTEGKLAKSIEASRSSSEKVIKPPEGPGLAFNVNIFRSGMRRFQEPNNKAIRAFKAMAVHSGNLGHELNEMREDATGLAALYSHRAMNALGRLGDAFVITARNGVRNGKYKTEDQGIAALKDFVDKRMSDIAAIEEPARREAALSTLIRENPTLRPLMDAVNEVNQLSRTLLSQLIKTHPNPTPDQLRLMNTIHNNSFRYATRMYAAFQGEAGRQRSKKLVTEYRKGKAALAKTGSVPERFRDSFIKYTNGMKYLIDHDLTIPDEEGLDEMSTDRLSQLYQTWIDSNVRETRQRVRAEALTSGYTEREADQVVRDHMIAALQERSVGLTEAHFEGKANDIIMGMLSLDDSIGPFATYYRGFAQDRSILEHREKLPKEIRDLFGEITDPSLRLAVTIAKQGELVARTRLLLDMKERGQGRWVIPGQDAGLPGNEKFTATLKGDQYGPLKGWRTTKDIARSIGNNLEMYSELTDALAKTYINTGPALDALFRNTGRGLQWIAARQKLLTVVADLHNIGQNFLGSPIALVSNGVINPKHYLSGLKVGAQVIADTLFDSKGNLSPELEDAIRYGLLDSARVQEIRSTPQRVIRQMISDEAKAARMAKSYGRRAVRFGVETFAMTDAWIKVSAWKDRVDTLTSFYKAEGIAKTDEEIKREAADTIKDTATTYSRTPPAVRLAEGIGATAFMPYFYSVPRVIMHNYLRGAKDLILAAHATTDAGKLIMLSSGVRRIAGASISTYGSVIALRFVASLINGDDDEEEKMKKLMTPDARFSDSIYLGKDKLGVPLFARLSRIDPYGPVNDILRVFMDEDTKPEDKSRYALNMVKDLFFTNRITQAAAKGLAEYITPEQAIADKRTKIERMSPKAAEKIKDWIDALPTLNVHDADAALAAADALIPGIADMWDPSNQRPAEYKDPALAIVADIVTMTGGRLDRADPSTASYVAGKRVNDARDEGRKRMAEGFEAGSSADDMVDRYRKAATNEYLAMRDASEVYEGMTQGLGLTPRQAMTFLKEDGKLTSSDVGQLRTGRINMESEDWIKENSKILSKDSLSQRQTISRKKMTKEEQKKNTEDQKKFLEIMKALGLRVK